MLRANIDYPAADHPILKALDRSLRQHVAEKPRNGPVYSFTSSQLIVVGFREFACCPGVNRANAWRVWAAWRKSSKAVRAFAYTYRAGLPDAQQIASDLAFCAADGVRPLTAASPAEDSDELLAIAMADLFFLASGLDPAKAISSCGFTGYSGVRQMILAYALWHGHSTPSSWNDKSVACLCRILSVFSAESAPPWMGGAFTALIRSVLETAALRGDTPCCR